MSCDNKSKNQKNCNCTYPCSRKGICCECLTYHRSMGQLPACYFPDNVESGYDRSIENFIRVVKNHGTSYLKK
jgi:hypothetical protein